MRQVEGNEYQYPVDPCPHQCKPVKCPNYILCDSVHPQWVADCNFGSCANCAIMSVHVVEMGELECPICIDTVLCIKQRNCDHHICLTCWKRCDYEIHFDSSLHRCHCGDPDEVNEPEFPYSAETEDAYYDREMNDHTWSEDELIIAYNNAWNEWDEARGRKRDNEENLRLCPICRS